MKKIIIVTICILFLASFSFADEQEINTQKKIVIKSLEKVKSSTYLSYDKYSEALADASTEIDILGRMWNRNECYSAIVGCYFDFDFAKLNWERENFAASSSSPNLQRSRIDAQKEKYASWRKGRQKLAEVYDKCFPKKE